MNILKFFLFTLKIFFINYIIYLAIKLYLFIFILILVLSFIVYFEIIKYENNVVLYSYILINENQTNELVDFFQEFINRFIFSIIKTYINIRDGGCINFIKQFSKKNLIIYFCILSLIILTKLKIIIIYILYCYINVPGDSDNLFSTFKDIYFKSLFNNPISDIFNSRVIIFVGNRFFSYKTPSTRHYDN